ncbi:cadherin-like protein 26 isoform X1 [Alosa sapidissima]|uniref:cadherin-like protein 26 isoform X1 n=1 Tax=Alosa sapidissima TaxID=34773 RepID=UPI001C08EE92|nr:cadherin-like protein 26 isoform X1 [Alosa sapidissima]
MATMGAWTISVLLILAVVLTDSATSRGKIRQKRNWIIDSFDMEEEYPGPYPYKLGMIQLDVKYLVNLHIHGQGVDLDPKDVLEIDQRDGTLWSKRKVNFEEYKLLKLNFEAKNVSNGEVDTRLGIEIQIKDVNDNAPQLEGEYKISLDESAKQGKDVITVRADDLDDSTTSNGTFDLRIVSVTPQDPDIDFVIAQEDTIGKITFKGCLNYEKYQKYTILVEAKDRGEVVQLSSTGTVTINVNDQNNHPPIFTGQTGSGIVKEGESGMTILRIQVSDEDTEGTPAWKAKYMLHGDPGGYFKITTDPETNEGVLTVVKPLDYEDGQLRKLSVTVENEEPYFTCQVNGRPQQGLWDVAWVGGDSDNLPPVISRPITITVEDTNDPPFFLPDVKNIRLMENSPVGTPLEKFTADDHDGVYASSFEYQVGKDPAGWVTVDSKTGQVSTTKVLDRESLYVNDSLYTAIIWAVDHGEPPMTGTGTLNIHLIDENDNVPVLDENALAMCLSDEPISASITAQDLDLRPYSDPFHFELLGDVHGRWKLDPKYGTKVNLVKDTAVYAGHHELTLKISDSQGQHSLQNLSVTVCDCTESQDCISRSRSTEMGGSAIGIVILGLLLLLALLLLASLISCKSEKVFIQPEESPGWHLLPSNIETPGTDCKVPYPVDQVDIGKAVNVKLINSTNPVIVMQESDMKSNVPGFSQYANGVSLNQQSTQEIASSKKSFWDMGFGYEEASTRKSFREFGYAEGSMMNRKFSHQESSSIRRDVLNSQLIQRLDMLETFENELGDYDPHVYAYEGEPASDAQLDAISIPGSEVDGNLLQNLHPKFRTLANICRPDLMEGIYSNGTV